MKSPAAPIQAVAHREGFTDPKIKIRFGEANINFEAREDIKMITHPGPIVRTIDGAGDEAELVQRRWSRAGTRQAAGVPVERSGRRAALRLAQCDRCVDG